ncbi:hypothetical protein FNB15_09435 [Ferrovibrio terrae]|uniref:Uncharacterized protein n=1 Tax=Ferrovibrio terrae TaxID=2594003 RepID=A0A516H130_9PROT|nr:hypothetical protein [Ferrovibrio terrae]QDO97474.1 hypothetical protein FNB15_09435 [Ferrovibrio terrae]
MSEPKPQTPPDDKAPKDKVPGDTPDYKKPIGDPPSREKPQTVQPQQQFTLEPGDHGRGSGPLHTEPLVKHSPQQERVGPGTYGNDQFAAEHHDDFVNDRELPEGLCDPQGGPLRPTAKPKEDRYGRIGGEGKG